MSNRNEVVSRNNKEPQVPKEVMGSRGFERVFQPGRLTVGFITPLEGYPDSPAPTLRNHGAIAQRADEIGVAALWLRDVPFYDPSFGDVGQIVDPMVYAGWLAAHTQHIAIGIAGIVLPLRDPLIVAKQAASVDQLLGGRMLLGLAGGDRPAEYPAFGAEYETRASRYRDARNVIRVATEEAFPRHRSQFYGELDGSLDLIPKPVARRLPAISIGRAGQTVEWIAQNMDGWITSGMDVRRIADVVPQWRKAVGPESFKPFGYGVWFDLATDPDSPLEVGRVFFRAGRNALLELWTQQERQGVSHVVLNLKPTRRPVEEILKEFAEYILPHFPAHE